MILLFTVYTTCGWFLCSWERRQYNALNYGLHGALNRRLNPHGMWRRWVRRSIPIGYLTIATLPTVLTADNRGDRSTCSRRRAPSIVSACASATRCIKVYRPRRRRQGYPMPPQTRHRCVVLFTVLLYTPLYRVHVASYDCFDFIKMYI